jgi:hypothetical protein
LEIYLDANVHAQEVHQRQHHAARTESSMQTHADADAPEIKHHVHQTKLSIPTHAIVNAQTRPQPNAQANKYSWTHHAAADVHKP